MSESELSKVETSTSPLRIWWNVPDVALLYEEGDNLTFASGKVLDEGAIRVGNGLLF